MITFPYASVDQQVLSHPDIEGSVYVFDLKVIDTNGDMVADVVEANAEEGWVRRYKRDAQGVLIIDYNKSKLLIEKVGMDIQIVLNRD